MFYVGQRVECIDAKPILGVEMPLKVGGIYEVADVRETEQGPHLVLREFGLLPRDMVRITPSGLFRATRFRPVVERKTSIEIFKAMLNPSREGVSA